MKLDQFSTLTFDCYGTLIDWETGILHGLRPLAARATQVPEDDSILAAFAAAEARAQAAHPARRYPEILADVVWSLAARWQVALEPHEPARFGDSVGDWPAFPDTAEALAYLKRYYRLVILSNVDRASFARSRARLGVEFDDVFTAEDIGSYKPDPANFAYMLRRLGAAGVGPESILHVAQSLYHDHVPAKQFGLATIWVDRRGGRHGGATPPAQAVPDRVVGSLGELAAVHRAESAHR